MNENTDPSGWRVTTQQEVTAQDTSGRYVPGVRVTFTTTDGIVGAVFIPESTYNTATVRDAINARVAQMRAIATLEG